MKDVNNIDTTNKEVSKEKVSGLSYKQLILIIFITTFVVMGVIGFSFSVLDVDHGPFQDNIINNIIAILRDDDKDDDDDDDDDEGSLIFTYYEKPGVGNGIKLINQFPVSDEIGKAFQGDNYVFDFSLLLNERAEGIKYHIVAEKLVNSDLRPDAVKIYLDSEGKILNSVIRDTGRLKTFNEFASYNDKRTSEKVIYTGVISKQEARRGYKNFTLKMWVSEDIKMTSSDFNKSFIVRINVYASGSL